MSDELKQEELRKFIEVERQKINRELDRLLPPADRYPQTLHRAIRHSVFAGGKRLRPILVLLAAHAFDFKPELAYPAGCAIEMIHTYSLIHDDLPALDNDDLRRGLPTCHKIYGEATAILAGDTLNTLAFGVLASLPYPPGRESVGLQLVKDLSDYAGLNGMAVGQFVDIDSEGKRIEPQTLEYIHNHKTASLIICSLRAGAILGRANAEDLDRMTDLGGLIGLAFQIKDDLLDITSTSDELGKSPGKDAAAGKATYPSVHGIEKAREELESLSTLAKKIALIFDKKSPFLYHIIDYLLLRRT
jgi:geranylgeranyl diphosphate synthase type II